MLALGGGVPVNDFLTADDLRELGFLIYLEVDPEVAFARIAQGGLPPFLAGDDPHGKFLKQYRERTVRYEALADWQLAVRGAPTPEKVHQLIMAEIKERMNL